MINHFASNQAVLLGRPKNIRLISKFFDVTIIFIGKRSNYRMTQFFTQRLYPDLSNICSQSLNSLIASFEH
jgi:hypothetical protein